MLSVTTLRLLTQLLHNQQLPVGAAEFEETVGAVLIARRELAAALAEAEAQEPSVNGSEPAVVGT